MIIFFSSYHEREVKLHNATREKPISTIERSPPIILKYYSNTTFPIVSKTGTVVYFGLGGLVGVLYILLVWVLGI